MLTMSSFLPCSSSSTPHRRPMSFNTSSSSLPSKLPRSASPLRRTGSYLSLTDLSGGNPQAVSNSYMSLRRFIENQERIFKQSHGLAITSHKPSSVLSPPKSSSGDAHRQRKSSPLSPVPHLLPPRPSFPRSKPEPDLYKVAIITRMRTSRGGQHTTVSVLSAIKDLEVIVARQQHDGDDHLTTGDVDGPQNNSWFISSEPEMTH